MSPKEMRKQILQMAYHGRSVHVPSAFCIVELINVLYESVLDHERGDKFVLSKGHGTMALYATLANRGILPDSAIANYFSEGSLLHGLPEAHTPGIEVSGGSLGHGLAIATGMAYGLKYHKKTQQKVFCLIGDGELNEGPNWESMLFAAHHKLDNLVVILDFNKYQAMGKVADVLGLEPLDTKFVGFGFEYRRCDGHDLLALSENLQHLKNCNHEGPRALVADTVKGKGLSFMEDNNVWHYTVLDSEHFERAMQEIEQNA